MQKSTRLRVGAVAVLVTAGFSLVGIVPANADPVTPPYPGLVGVGSDTTQDVIAGLATAIPAIGSYDAFTTTGSMIKVTSAGPSFLRPNGSTEGVKALSAAAQGTAYSSVPLPLDEVDFARSSSGASGTGTVLTWIPFATDALGMAVHAASEWPRDIPLGSAAGDSATNQAFTLRNIYRGTVTSYSDSNFEPVIINPLLPQTGSGTRKFWVETVLGLTDSTVVGSNLNNTLQENNGTFVTGLGDIVPFSVASYISQANHAAIASASLAPVTERRGSIALVNVGSTKPIAVEAGKTVLNTSYLPALKRTVYNVVRTSRLADTDIAATFVGATSAVCANPVIIKAYGFGTTTNCGATTIRGSYK